MIQPRIGRLVVPGMHALAVPPSPPAMDSSSIASSATTIFSPCSSFPLRSVRLLGSSPLSFAPVHFPKLSTTAQHRAPKTCIARCHGEEYLSNSEGYLPDADFFKVEAILRPWRLSHVTSGLLRMGIRGVTVSDVRGFGSQVGARERQAGSEFSEDSFVRKVKLEIVVSKDQVDDVINTIIDCARTGEIGDGKIFVVPVADVIRVRTGERGLKGERMIGGRAEILAASHKDIPN